MPLAPDISHKLHCSNPESADWKQHFLTADLNQDGSMLLEAERYNEQLIVPAEGLLALYKLLQQHFDDSSPDTGRHASGNDA